MSTAPRGSARQQARRRALALLKQSAPAPARRFAKRVAGRRYIEAQRLVSEPVLSVVVPVYNVEQYLRECLDSALRQTLYNLEVIAVDDGSTDGSLAILREYEASDARVRVYTQTNSGQGIARNLGVTHARGAYLAFLDADDVVPPRAYDVMIKTLASTGSDFVVGNTRRFTNGQFSPTPWTRAVHESDRLATTIDAFPTAMLDVIACNRVFRTQFWVDKVGAFRGHIAYEDHVPMLTAYVRARSFDVLARATYHWRQREDRTSTSQQKASLENLLDRIAVKEEAHEMLKNEASTLVYDSWVARALEIDFPPFIAFALAANDMYRNILSATYRTFFARTSPDAMQQVRFFQKLRGWLVAESRWEDLEGASEYFRQYGQLPPTRVEDGRIYAATPEDSHFLADVPDTIGELSALETGLLAALERVRWVSDHELAVNGWAMVGSLDTSTEHPETTAWLEDIVTGRRVDLPVRPERTLGASRWARHHNAAYDAAGFSLRIDLRDLGPDERDTSTTWALRVRVSHRGVVREGPVHNRVAGSSSTFLIARPVSLARGRPGRVLPVQDGSQGFSVRVEPVAVVAEKLVADSSKRRVTGVLRVLDPAVVPVRLAVTEGDGATATLTKSRNGDLRFSVTLPGKDEPGRWSLAVVGADGRETPLAWPEGVEGRVGSRAVGSVAVTRGIEGDVEVKADSPLLHVDAVRVTATTIDLDVTSEGVPDQAWTGAVLGNDNDNLPLVDLHREQGAVTRLSFSKRTHRLGGPKLPAPSGNYALKIPLGDDVVARGAAGPELVPQLPVDLTDPELDLQLLLSPAGELRVVVNPPLAPDEQGPTAQKALQRHFRTREVVPEASVFFQCYRGEFATDSQRALDEGLRRARPDLTRYWGVKDLSTEVPEGGVPVVIGSSAWYDALASSTYICNNIDFDGFFVKRPHQRYLQTFHGYPFKSMGATFWAGKGWGPDRIAAELARRNREWDTILVPSEACAAFYRQEYLYEGDVLVSGYPRSDFVVNADPVEVRERVLGRLGVPTDKTVVLYAPTYRDNLTTRVFAARIFDELDLVELTERLGEDFVVLLRGHNNNQRELDRVREIARVVDVTDWPEINELTVAADVAVLDYSSLRFDWALTGKPMVFFVPDLDSYFAARPPLFDYRDTAPGPLVSTTAEVVDRLRHLDDVRDDYAPQIEAFNKEFNGLHDGHATERVIDAFFRD